VLKGEGGRTAQHLGPNVVPIIRIGQKRHHNQTHAVDVSSMGKQDVNGGRGWAKKIESSRAQVVLAGKAPRHPSRSGAAYARKDLAPTTQIQGLPVNQDQAADKRGGGSETEAKYTIELSVEGGTKTPFSP